MADRCDTRSEPVAGAGFVSGRFDALVAIAQGSSALFSCLERRVEGRALRAVGPPSELAPILSGDATTVLTLLSGLVAAAQWTPDVCMYVRMYVCMYVCVLHG